MRDEYRSESASPAHRFLVILYYQNRIDPIVAEADCYADAIEQVAPGNDVIKVEVIAL